VSRFCRPGIARRPSEWPSTAPDHAVEDVLGQIERDRHRYLAVAPRKTAAP
jgi:hypothetical protein